MSCMWSHSQSSSLPSLLFSLVALYFLNRISHSVYDSSPPPKVVMSTRGALGKSPSGKSPSGKGKVKHGWTNDHIRIHCNWLMLHSHFSFIDSSCSTFNLVSFPDHFSPHNVEKNGLGMRLNSVICFEVDYYLEARTLIYKLIKNACDLWPLLTWGRIDAMPQRAKGAALRK